MAAPADKRTRLCDKCFATVEVGAPYCPECGAPMDGGNHAESSDAAIYPQLARANLLRMRAEYKQSEDVCLGILKRLPNNASAHTLLGDICAERGDLEQAVEWYELSLDITPDAKVRDKLMSAKQRIHERDAAATAEQIGLPAKQPKFVVPIVVALVIMAAIGVAAFFLGQKTEAKRHAPVVDVSSGTGGPRVDTGTTGDTQEPTGAEEAAPSGTWRDDQFTRFLADQFEDGRRINDAWQDPRTQAVSVTVSATKDEDARAIAARMGSSAIERVPNASVVTVRVVVDGKLALVADVERTNWTQANSDAWKQQHPDDPQATVDLLLSNEWPARDSVVTPPNTTGGEQPTGGTETPGGTTTGQTTESTTGQ